jgi:acyl-coenzyme A thioesterase PaaI-like protein
MFTQLPVAGLLAAQPIRCDRSAAASPSRSRRAASYFIGSVQGGMLTAMLDLAMSFAVLCTLDDGHVVPSLEVKDELYRSRSESVP